MKINQIRLSRLRNDTHFQFHTEFKDLAQKHNPAAMKIASQYGAYPNMRLLLPHRWVGCIRKRAGEKIQQLEVLMNKTKFTSLAASLVLAMAFTFSCSSDGSGESGGEGKITKSKITGVSQKGPFVEGSTATLYELNEGFEQTGRSFKSIITDNKGSFEIKGIELTSPYAMLEASGYYRNEVTGEVSKGPITLFAIADVREKDNINVNSLTHLEYYRVLNLAEGGKSVAEAKKQAQKEILAVFGINGNFENSEDMSIFGKTDGDAALLAISILLQSNLGEGEFSQRLTNFAQSLKESGKWENEAAKTAIADWVEVGFSAGLADPNGKYCRYPSSPEYSNNCWPMPTDDMCAAGVLVNSCSGGNISPSSSSVRRSSSSTPIRALLLDGDVISSDVNGETYFISSIRKNILAWGLSSEVPDFGKYIIAYWKAAYGLGDCGSANNGDIIKDNRNVNRICKTGNWAVASTLEYDTYKLSCSAANEGEIKKGSVSSTEYICKTGNWAVASMLEQDTYQFSCSATNDGEIKKGSVSGEDYVCENKAWRYATYVETDIQSVCLASNEGEIKAGKASGENYVCENKAWRTATYEETDVQSVCLASNEGEIKTGKATGTDYICKSKAWQEATEFERDTYKLSCSATNEGETKKGNASDNVYTCKNKVWQEASYKEKSCFENKCSYFTDTRDKQRYSYVVIGEQTWMAENLNYNASGSKCYENEDANCDKYGRLYDWNTALKSCPSGWHLPTEEEWEVMVTYIGGERTEGKKLKTTSGWDSNGNGTDEYGFSALPGGGGYGNGSFSSVGGYGYWWSATEGIADYAYYRYIYYSSSSVYRSYDSKSGLFISLRCLQD